MGCYAISLCTPFLPHQHVRASRPLLQPIRKTTIISCLLHNPHSSAAPHANKQQVVQWRSLRCIRELKLNLLHKLAIWLRYVALILALSLLSGRRIAAASSHLQPVPVLACLNSSFTALKNGEESSVVDDDCREKASSMDVGTSDAQTSSATQETDGDTQRQCEEDSNEEEEEDEEEEDEDDDEDEEDEDEDEDDDDDYDAEDDDAEEEEDTFGIVSDKEADYTLEGSASTNSDTSRMTGEHPQFHKDEELGKAFEAWKSKPYKLTVPLRLISLQGSMPPVWLKDFILSQGRRVKTMVEYKGSLKDILVALASDLSKKQIKPRSIIAADLVTIGDAWLRIAVVGGLIEPIKNADKTDWFQKLGSNWQILVRRNNEGHLDPQGKIWGVPYRWGNVVIAYKKEQLAKVNLPSIKDWSDLWRPELAGKIAMVDSPREVVGAVLKSLGASYNTKNMEKDVRGGREAVKQQFLEFQKQVRLFDSVQYLKAFGTGDIWVIVGWSSDVIPLAKRMSNIAVVAPESGTSLWADLWAIPAAVKIQSDKIGSRVKGPSPLIDEWFDFCLQPARALPFQQGVFVGASPLQWVQEYGSDMPTETKALHNTGPKFDTNLVGGMPPKEIMLKSEFLEPLPEETLMDYEWLFSHSSSAAHNLKFSIWQSIRQLQWSFWLTKSMGLRH